MDNLCNKGKLLQQIRQRYDSGQILELRMIDGICTLRLRNGQLFMARLDRRGNLRLEELEGAC